MADLRQNSNDEDQPVSDLHTYKVRVNGRTYIVSVDQLSQGVFEATLNNEKIQCESIKDADVSAWIIDSIDDVVRAQTKALPGGEIDVWLAGTPFQASVQMTSLESAHIPAKSEKRASGQLRSLMLGRIKAYSSVKETESR